MYKKPSQKTVWKLLTVLFSLLVLLTAGGAPLTAAGAPLPDRLGRLAALVRLDLPSPESLNALAAQELSVYAEIYTADEQVILLLPANPDLQAELTRQGYSVQVLDPQARDAEYFLVEGPPEGLQQIAAITPLLLIESRLTTSQQAVVRSTSTQAESFSSLGVLWRPLRLHTLQASVLPKASLQAAALLPSPQVQQMLTQVSQTQLYNHVGGLSGEWPVTIESSPYTLSTRYTRASTPIQKATRYVRDYFLSLGLQADYDYYSLTGYERRNVMAQQVGVGQPSRIFLLTAHMDSYSNAPYSLAPGADDNASGTAAVMHIASILRSYQFDCTLRYVLFTGEEQGLYGSYYYAEDMYNQGQDIEGVLNLDMIAYNTIGSYPSLELNIRSGNAYDLAIANLFKDAVTTYQIGLYPTIIQPGKTFSDHASFWEFGFPAILAIEDWTDHTPDYHLTTDRLGTLNMSYYTNFTRAALATFAHMGCLREGKLAGRVTDAKTGLPISGALVKAQLDASHSWQTNTLGDGMYQISLVPGAYTVSASAAAHQTASLNNIAINNTQTTTQNFALQPCSEFQNLNFTYSPFEPNIGQTVTFNASVTGASPSYSWSFGDGGSASGQSAIHAFTTAGAFQVTLTVTNACTPTTISKTIPVGLGFHLYLPLSNWTP